MNLLIRILYEIALWVLALIAIPKLLYNLFVHKKYRSNFLARLGIGYPSIRKGKPLVWIHAISVGEVKAVASLARAIKQSYPDIQLLISSVTETGHEEAKRSISFADYHVYLPFDFYFVMRRIIKKVSPRLVILCESDFWLNFLYLAKKYGASLSLVNGKLSEASMKRFQKVSVFSRLLFGLFDIACIQNVLYQERFIKVGIPPKRVFVTGNLKFDDDYPQLSSKEIKEWREKLGINLGQIVLTIGSTHYPEENSILDVLQGIWRKIPSLKVILVPRHPERFKEVADLLEKKHIDFIHFTDINQRSGKEKVILVDAMGLLRMCYQLSDIAIIGGSFTLRVGGHNILEPCWYGKPILFGPYMHAQIELVNLVHQYEAGIQLDLQELPCILEELIWNANKRDKIGQKGRHLINALKGSTSRSLHILEPLLINLH